MTDVDVARYLKVLWRWTWLVLLAAVVAGGVSYRVSQFLPRVYRASSTLMVGDYTSNPNVSPDQIQTSERLAGTYSEMIQREPVLSATVSALGLPTDWQGLRDRVLVTHSDGSQIIEIRVIDSDPKRAQAIAQEIMRQIVLQSPTQASTRELDQRREFVRQQLDSLQANIKQGEETLVAKQDQVGKESSARVVLDLQDEIKALDLKLTEWRSTYASLVATSQGRPPNTLNVIEPPSVDSQPVSPNVRANVLLAVALGVLLAISAICLIEYFNDTVEAADDLARILPLPVLGTLRYAGRIKNPLDALVTVANPTSAESERYRLLRTNILAMTADDGIVPLVVTSPGTNEGKSFTSANLAVSFAQSGRTVILVDADIRNPTLHRYFGYSNESGLTTVLATDSAAVGPPVGERGLAVTPGQQLERALEQSLVETHIPGLRLLPSGPFLTFPGELLGSTRMSQVLRILQRMADFVILDSPPVLAVTDTALLTGKWAVALLVLEVGRTKTQDLRIAYESLQLNRSRILGTVLNKVPQSTYADREYSRYYRPKKVTPTRGSRIPFIGRARPTDQVG